MKVNVLLFDDFDALDAFGVAGVLGKVPEFFQMNYVSVTGNIVNSMQGMKIWTERLELEQSGGILLIPGGGGARRLIFQDEETMKIVKRVIEKSEYCLMVATGSALPAQTGLLYRRKIAQCQMDENWKRMFTAGIAEVPGASWVADGKFYSSSNTLNGISMALTLIADLVDLERAEQIAGQMGYNWDADDESAYQ